MYAKCEHSWPLRKYLFSWKVNPHKFLLENQSDKCYFWLWVFFFCLCWLNMWKLDKIQFNGKVQSSKLMKISELKWNATHLSTEDKRKFCFQQYVKKWVNFFCRKVNTYLFLDMMSAFQLCNFFLLATSNTDSWSSIISCGCEVLPKSNENAQSVNNKFASVYFFPASQKCCDLIMCDFLWP